MIRFGFRTFLIAQSNACGVVITGKTDGEGNDMKVMVGWSAETSSGNWRKFEVTLEQEDWDYLKTTHELPETSTSLKYLFIENEAQILLATHVLLNFPDRFGDDAKTKITSAQEHRTALIKKIKE